MNKPLEDSTTNRRKYSWKDILDLRVFFTDREVKGIVIIVVLALTGAVLEAIGIAIVPLYITAITTPSEIANHSYFSSFFGELPEKVNLKIFGWASLIFVGMILLKNAAMTLLVFFRSTILMGQNNRLRDTIFRSYQGASYAWMAQRNSSELIRNIQDDSGKIMNGIIVPSVTLLTNGLVLIFVLGTMIYSAPVATLLSATIVASGILVVITLLKGFVSRAGQVIRIEFAKSLRAIQVAFAAIVDVRIHDKEDVFAHQHIQSFRRLTNASRTQSVVQAAIPYAIETISMLGLVAILWIFIRNAESIASSLPVLTMLAFGTIRLKQAGSQLSTSLNKIHASLPSIPELVNDYNEIQKTENGVCNNDSVIKVSSPREVGEEFRSLELSKICFGYPESARYVVKNLNFYLHSGESVAIVGETGGGKSTIVRLILGLMRPTQGMVNVNGKDIHEDLSGWRNRVGYIPQSVYMLDDTIRRNVAFGVKDEEIDDELVWTALRTAHIDGFVESLSGKLDATIGELGVRMSGGQRQRLGIARALFRNPEVMVLDEATSALDDQTESAVMEAIDELQQSKTMIIIAHRLKTIKNCDRFINVGIEGTQIVDSYEELMRIQSAKIDR